MTRRPSVRRSRRRPKYESSEVCHNCGATPTNVESGLCRYCDNGGDDDGE